MAKSLTPKPCGYICIVALYFSSLSLLDVEYDCATRSVVIEHPFTPNYLLRTIDMDMSDIESILQGAVLRWSESRSTTKVPTINTYLTYM